MLNNTIIFALFSKTTDEKAAELEKKAMQLADVKINLDKKAAEIRQKERIVGNAEARVEKLKKEHERIKKELDAAKELLTVTTKGHEAKLAEMKKAEMKPKPAAPVAQ